MALSGNIFTLAQQGLGHWSNLSVVFGEETFYGLTGRDTCPAGYGLCPDSDRCCPFGDTCNPYGCCPAGEELCSTDTCYNPSTEICCSDGRHCDLGEDCVGSDSCCPSGYLPCGTEHCYDPDTELCCADSVNEGGCPKTDTCCGNECCRSYATCGDDGYCSGIICTEYSTTEVTELAMDTSCVTITTEPRDGEDDDFDCDEITVVNPDNATMELGSDCIFTYHAPPSTSATSTTTSVNDVVARRGHLVHPRATQDPNVGSACYETYTSVIVSTIYTTEAEDCTTTVEASESPSGFSCVPMTVSDGRGDQLILDTDCHFALSINLATQTQTTHRPGGVSGANANPTVGASKANVQHAPKGFVVAVVALCVMAITMAWM